MTNEEKFKTPEDREKAYKDFCRSHECTCGCPLEYCSDCHFPWLALEVEDEKPEPCFLCGSETFVNTHSEGYEVRCTQRNCYISKTFENKEAAIAAHNRVCRAVKAANESEVAK